MTGEQSDYFGTGATRSILIVDSAHTRALLEIANHTKNTVPIVVPTLESIVLSNYLVCIVPNASELSREEVKENVLTPVVFFGSQQERDELIKNATDESFDDPIGSALRKYNLFDMADIKERFEVINEAILEKDQLLSYLERLPVERRTDVLQKKYDPPRFRIFFEYVRKVHDEQEGGALIVPGDPKQQIAAFDALLIQKMREWHYCHPTAKFKKELESETAELVLKYLKQREDGIRKDPLLGKSQYGEGSADRLSTSLQRIPYNPHGEFRWRVGRLIVDDNPAVEGDDPNEHTHISKQRHRDAKRLNQENSTIKTALIGKPLHLDNYGRDASFLIMQDIEGPTLDQVLKKLTDEIDRTGDNKKNDLLGRVRKELVDKYVGDIITWQNNEELKTFAKKPSGAKVIEEYKTRISDFQEIFEKLTPGLFSMEEGLAYLDALACLERVATSPQDIVRVMDASMNNVHLSFDRIKYDPEKQEFIFNIDDILSNTANQARGSIDREKIGKIFCHVDLHYRYGHVLEDIAHIITARETAFLIQNDDERDEKKPHVLSKRATTEKSVNAITRNFLREIQREDLLEDKLSRYLMFFYRSARKLKLCAARYARNALEEYKRRQIRTREVFDERRKYFQDIIMHHTRSCHAILLILSEHVRTLNMNTEERGKVDDWRRDARTMYDDKLAVRYEKELNNLKDPNARLHAQISVLSSTFKKLQGYFGQGNKLHFENVVNIPPPAVRVKHVWLDCDGTLYRTDERLDALRENAIYNEIESRTGRRIGDIAREYPVRLKEFKSNTNTIKSFGFTEEQAREIYNSFDITKHLEKDEVLEKTIESILNQKILVSIFTNNKRSVLFNILEKLGLNVDRFSNLMTAEEVAPKPSTEGYKRIIARSGCNPHEIIYVGDREETEIVPAKKEGLNTILVWDKSDYMLCDQNNLTYHFKKKTVYEVKNVIDELHALGREQSTGR